MEAHRVFADPSTRGDRRRQLPIHCVRCGNRDLVERRSQSVHAGRLRRLPHQGRGHRPVAILRRPTRTDLAGPHLAARRHQRQRHAVHLHRGLRRRRRGAEPRQPEDRVPRPHRVARRRRAGAAVHGALQHDASTANRSQKDPDAIVKVAYANFVREPLRTFARDEVQRRNGLRGQGRADPDRRRRAGAHPQPTRTAAPSSSQRRRRQRAVSGGGRERGVAQARRDAGAGSARTRRSKSSARSAPSAKCRRRASPTPCRSSAVS